MTPSGAETVVRLVLDTSAYSHWIAAATLDCGGHLLTFDDHFDKTPSVDRTVLPVPNRPLRS